MLTLLGSALGFGASLLPKIFDFVQDRADKKHELALVVRQAELQKQTQALKLQEVQIETNFKEQELAVRELESLHSHSSSILTKSSQWVVNLAGTVRPVITYSLMLAFIILSLLLSASLLTTDEFNTIWSAEMKVIFSSVLSFWFGQRAFNKK